MKSKQRVAVIIPGGIGTGRDNIGVPVLEQIISLLAQDFDVTVFQLFKVNRGYTARGFNLIEVYSTSPVLKYIRLFSIFRKVHRQQKFDVVHGFWILPNGFFSVLFGKFFGIKSIVSILGGDAISLPQIKYGQLQKPLYKKLIFWTLRHADRANALTHYLINNLRNAGFERKDFEVIPWGIDTEVFRYVDKPLQNPIRFLHIANLHPVKDQRTMLLAFDKIRKEIPSKLLMIGEGVLEDDLRKLILEFDLRAYVEMMGPFTKTLGESYWL